MRRITISIYDDTTDEDALDMVLSLSGVGRKNETQHRHLP